MENTETIGKTCHVLIEDNRYGISHKRFRSLSFLGFEGVGRGCGVKVDLQGSCQSPAHNIGGGLEREEEVTPLRLKCPCQIWTFYLLNIIDPMPLDHPFGSYMR